MERNLDWEKIEQQESLEEPQDEYVEKDRFKLSMLTPEERAERDFLILQKAKADRIVEAFKNKKIPWADKFEKLSAIREESKRWYLNRKGRLVPKQLDKGEIRASMGKIIREIYEIAHGREQ